MTARTACLVLSPLILYLLAVNPYILPDTSDNLGYYYGALSIAEDGRYEFDGQFIDAWPPGFPALLAIPFSLGFTSIVTAKLVVTVLAGLGMIFTFLLLSREGIRQPALVTVIAWLLPDVMLSGSSIMSECPFLALSLIFLYLLGLQRENRRGLPFALCVGLVFGWASLTRWLGILLGVAVLVQALLQLRKRKDEPIWKRCLPEVATGVTGGAMVLAWYVLFIGSLDRMQVFGDWNRFEKQLAVTEARREAGGDSAWFQWEAWPTKKVDQEETPGKVATLSSPVRPLLAPEHMSRFLFQPNSILRLAGLPTSHPLRHLFLIPLIAVAAGIAGRLFTRRAGPADSYVLALIVTYASLPWYPPRYWVVLAPFLVAYLFEGSHLLWSRLTRSFPFAGKSRLPAAAAAAYLLFLVAIAADRLFLPNFPYGALCYVASPRPEKFYQGYWANLYAACDAIRRDGGGGDLVFAGRTEPERGYAGIYDYVEHFTGCRARNYPPAPESPVKYLLVKAPLEVPGTLVEELGLTLLKETNEFKSYRVGPGR